MRDIFSSSRILHRSPTIDCGAIRIFTLLSFIKDDLDHDPELGFGLLGVLGLFGLVKGNLLEKLTWFHNLEYNCDHI